jgi:hypothetical protein
LNGQLHGRLIVKLVGKVFDSCPDQVANCPGVNESGGLEDLQLPGVQPYVDLALGHARAFPSVLCDMRICDDATELRS